MQCMSLFLPKSEAVFRKGMCCDVCHTCFSLEGWERFVAGCVITGPMEWGEEQGVPGSGGLPHVENAKTCDFFQA